MNALPYEPKVENRYNLTYSAVKALKIGNRSLIKSPMFFWNGAISAWCICDLSSIYNYSQNSYLFNRYLIHVCNHRSTFAQADYFSDSTYK